MSVNTPPMSTIANPFRPRAGHPPPFLAGRQAEKRAFERLIGQTTILENLLLTGLRGVGKTVLLDSFRPVAIEKGWLWVGSDINEASSLSDENMAVRLCTDLALATSSLVVGSTSWQPAGFSSETRIKHQTLSYDALWTIYERTPGLALDKVKAVLEVAWSAMSSEGRVRGLVFAYDEAQNLSDHAGKEHFPLSLLLDAFQSIQRRGLPILLALTGLPTLASKLTEARTFSERMFHSVFLRGLSEKDSRDAILRPINNQKSPVRLTDESVETVIKMSGGYPYFIQFICREIYDAFMQRIDRGEQASVPAHEIERKLDADFFSGRWSRLTDRQRDLFFAIVQLPNCDEEFTVQEIVEASAKTLERGFGNSHTSQILATLCGQGFVYKNRHGKYAFAIPMFSAFVRRQLQGV